MIPTTPVLMREMTEVEIPSRTYKLHTEIQRISGWTDEQEAVAQAIYLILNIERYQYIIYSWNYGVELNDLLGMPMPYVESEIARRIEEALLQDDRILSVGDFTYNRKDKRTLYVTFTAYTKYGDIAAETEVNA